MPLERLLERAAADIEAGRPAAAVEHLLAHEAAFAGEAAYNRRLATAALRAGDLATAVTALRRLILLQPGDLGARLDLAIAEYRRGNRAAARRRFDALAKRDPPPGVRRVIEQYRTRLADDAEATWRLHGALPTRGGYATNVNNGTESDRIDLRIGGRPVRLALDDDNQARGDAFLDQTVSARLQRDSAARPHLMARISREVHSSASAYDNTLLALGAGVTPSLDARTRLHLDARWLRFERRLGDRLDITRLALEIERALAPRWRGRIGLDLRRERFADGSGSDGDIQRLRLGLVHRRRAWRAGVEFMVGRDEAVGRRAGGDRVLRRLRLRAAGSVTPRLEARASLAWREERDRQPFSPAFFGATERESETVRLAVAAAYRLTPRLQALARVAHRAERANLALFEQPGTRVSIGLRWAF